MTPRSPHPQPPSKARTPWGAVIAFMGAVGCAVGFAVAYGFDGSTEVYGLTLGGGLAFVSIGLGLWSRSLDKQEPEYVEERALGPTPEPQYAAFRSALTNQPVARSGVLWSMFGLAVTSLGAAALFPLRSLFPRPVSPDLLLTVTPWRPGVRLVDVDGLPISPADLEPGAVITAFPEGVEPAEHADTTTLVIGVEPALLRLPVERLGWVVDGVVAYSKICTHAGCPVGLYADTYTQLVCPCHYSIFDVLTAAIPIEGPAARPLPQLPLGLDEEGYLIAMGDFSAPVGPGWWRYPE